MAKKIEENTIIHIANIDDLKKYYVNAGVLGQLIGCSARYVATLSNDTIIRAETMPGGRRTAYPLQKTLNNYCEHLRNKATGKTSTNKEAELKQKKLEVEISLKESQNELHRLKTDIQAGRFIAVEDVKADYDKFFIILKKFVLSMPSRVGVLINGYVDPMTVRSIEADLSKEITSMLNAFIVAAVAENAEIEALDNGTKD